MTLTCPVCETQNDDSERCKQCSTDLGPLVRVATLPLDYYREGINLLDRGEIEAAIEKLSAAASLDATSADVQVALGRACQRQGINDAAIAHFDRAAELAPDRQDIPQLRANAVSAESGRNAAAIAETRKAVRLRRLLWALPPAAFLLGLVTLAGIERASRPSAVPADAASGVQARLQANPATRGLALKIASRDGVVQVAGEAPSALHIELIRAIAGQGAAGRVDFSGLQTAKPAAPAQATYRVRPGDSLWLIARRKYGNAALWPKIEQANPGRRSLNVGDSLVLPEVVIQPK